MDPGRQNREHNETPRHSSLSKKERNIWRISKELEKDTETILITQDFTQLDLESGFIQDSMICCYWYDSDSKDGLGRDYRHFVGQKGDKNDIKFVAGCWKQLLEEHWFNTPSKVLIWSDGGPKHFKISANLKLFQVIQRERSDIDWEYHFFPAYHGCNVCDSVAS